VESFKIEFMDIVSRAMNHRLLADAMKGFGKTLVKDVRVLLGNCAVEALEVRIMLCSTGIAAAAIISCNVGSFDPTIVLWAKVHPAH
jgi:hypothetical protein